MLDKIGTEAYRTISKADWDVIDACRGVIDDGQDHPVIAEIGVGIGATTLELAKVMENRGEIHIFDFAEQVNELSRDLAERGFNNVIPHGNTGRYWDSYHWSLARLIERSLHQEDLFDMIYIDGAHTYLHDALAFFMCDRLLKPGGLILFDDYNWRYADSRYMRNRRHEYMTEEQENSHQVRMFIDHLVKTSPAYEEFLSNKGFKKVSRTSRIE